MLVKEVNHSANTIYYNGVVFGSLGSFSIGNTTFQYRSLPPQYRLMSVPRYDESRRNVIGIDYTIYISAIFYSLEEYYTAAIMQYIRSKLQEAGKPLKIVGVGNYFLNGIETIETNSYADLDNGPKPGPLYMNPLGSLCWEVNWSVTFFVSECNANPLVTGSPSDPKFPIIEKVISVSWSNDFEGITTRIIEGFITIPSYRMRDNLSKKVLARAEQTRGQIIALVPPLFKRVQNTWAESPDKRRLTFSIVDKQLPGDQYPNDVTLASGSFTFSSGGKDIAPAMASGLFTIEATFKVKPGAPRNLAAVLFFQLALSKQIEIQTLLNQYHAQDPNNVPPGVIIPAEFVMSNRKFDDARVSSFRMSWNVTQRFWELIKATDVFAPVHQYIPNTYTQWANSMNNVWNNRGILGIQGNVSDQELQIVDVCDQPANQTIGASTVGTPISGSLNLPSLTCPEIPPDGGWIFVHMTVDIYKDHQLVQHLRAVDFVPYNNYEVENPTMEGEPIKLGGPTYNLTNDQKHIEEYAGAPVNVVVLKYRAARYKYTPAMPEIKTIDGMIAIETAASISAPVRTGDTFGCPIYGLSGYRIYRVEGDIKNVKPIIKLSLSDPKVPDTL
jgi:hypothetical protein